MPSLDLIDLPGREARGPRGRVYLWFRDRPYLLWPMWVGVAVLLPSTPGLASGAAYYWPRQYAITSDQSAILVYAGVALLVGLIFTFTAPGAMASKNARPDAADFHYLRETREILAELVERAERWADTDARRARLSQILELAAAAEEEAKGYLKKEASYRWQIMWELYRVEKLTLEVHRFVSDQETGRGDLGGWGGFQFWGMR